LDSPPRAGTRSPPQARVSAVEPIQVAGGPLASNIVFSDTVVERAVRRKPVRRPRDRSATPAAPIR
jgi:hypothetical protein